VAEEVVNRYVRGWVRVLYSGDAGGTAVVGYHMTGGTLARRFGELVRRLCAEAVSLKRSSLSGVACIGWSWRRGQTSVRSSSR
jgi:hypothetical protein